jgi:hypothetical protein
VKLPRIAAPPWDRARRRRAPRDGAPRTIVPVAEAPDEAARADAAVPFAARVDQARARLRAAIPPVADGEQE